MRCRPSMRMSPTVKSELPRLREADSSGICAWMVPAVHTRATARASRNRMRLTDPLFWSARLAEMPRDVIVEGEAHEQDEHDDAHLLAQHLRPDRQPLP